MEIVDEAVAEGVIDNRELAAFYLLSFYKIMANRLFNEDKPVDLGFCRLHNLPYCADWKERLFKKFGDVSRKLDNRVNPERIAARINLNPMQRLEFAALDLLATNGDRGYVYWRVEVEHTNQWWRMVQRAERTRLLNLGPRDYALQLTERIVNCVSKAATLYKQWAAAITRRPRPLPEDYRRGIFRFVPILGVWRGNEFTPFPPLSDKQLMALADEPNFLGYPKDLFRPPFRVPKVPDIQPPSENVRDGVEPRPMDRPAGQQG
jgi:hypothetical protein